MTKTPVIFQKNLNKIVGGVSIQFDSNNAYVQ